MSHLLKTLDAFFSSEAKVLVIKGDWGVGKTYFWEDYINKRIELRDLKQLAYSYISLFGVSSIDDIRQKVFHNAKAISTDKNILKDYEEEIKESNFFRNKKKLILDGLSRARDNASLVSMLSKHVKNVPIINKFSGVLNVLEYSLVNNFIICIDDIERKGKGLTIRETMGLVDELSQRKGCKVILIFNENSFDSTEDKDQFESYREKVVDIEINYNPTCKENLNCIFKSENEEYSLIEDFIINIDIKNIRVLRKIDWTLKFFEIYFKDVDVKIKREFVLRSVLLSWSYYIRDKDLTYEIFKEKLKGNSFFSRVFDDKKELSEADKKFDSLSSRMFLGTSVFDEHITFFLENGYVDSDTLKNTLLGLKEKMHVDSIRSKIIKAWDIYSDSFDDNLDVFKESFINILNEYISDLNFSDFSSAIDVLEEFGVEVTDYIDSYVEIHKEFISGLDVTDSIRMSRFKSKLFKEKIELVHKEKLTLNIDDLSLKIARNRSWNPIDIDYLNSLSVVDYYNWMKGDPSELLTKLRSGLLTFRGLGAQNSSDQEKYSNISNNVTSALKMIASENEFNRKRVRDLYRIETE